MARKQQGWLRPKQYAAGKTWVFYYHVTRPLDGKRVEHSKVVGLVSQIGTSKAAAWREVERLGLTGNINTACSAEPTFIALAEHYKSHGLRRKRLTKEKDEGSIYTLSHNLDDYVLPRWGTHVATAITPIEFEDWLVALHEKSGLAWGTVSKIRQALNAVFANARKRQLIPADHDPLKDIQCEAESDYRPLTCEPEETVAILSHLEGMERVLTVLIAATGIRISEALALRWADINYGKGHIDIRYRFRLGGLADPKTRASNAPVPMCSALADFLKAWQAETPYARPRDFVFFSAKLKGRKPRTGNMISQKYLKPAAVKAGVLTLDKKGQYFDRHGLPVGRFGFHNLRHSLSTWLVGSGEDPKVVQGMLRHANVTTTLERYTQVVPRKTTAAQEKYMEALLSPKEKPEPTASPSASNGVNRGVNRVGNRADETPGDQQISCEGLKEEW